MWFWSTRRRPNRNGVGVETVAGWGTPLVMGVSMSQKSGGYEQMTEGRVRRARFGSCLGRLSVRREQLARVETAKKKAS